MRKSQLWSPTNISIECLGTELVRRLIHIARDQRLGRIEAEMLRDNLAMQTTFRKLGFRLRLLDDSSSVQAVLDL